MNYYSRTFRNSNTTRATEVYRAISASVSSLFFSILLSSSPPPSYYYCYHYYFEYFPSISLIFFTCMEHAFLDLLIWKTDELEKAL